LSFFVRNDNISFGWNFVREELQRSPEGIHIVDLFSFLISFALKKEEQESSLDFAIVHEQRKIIFSWAED
jgi:hypothetical protein